MKSQRTAPAPLLCTPPSATASNLGSHGPGDSALTGPDSIPIPLWLLCRSRQGWEGDSCGQGEAGSATHSRGGQCAPVTHPQGSCLKLPVCPAQPPEPLTRQVPGSLQFCSAYTVSWPQSLWPSPWPLSTLRPTHPVGLWGWSPCLPRLQGHPPLSTGEPNARLPPCQVSRVLVPEHNSH